MIQLGSEGSDSKAFYNEYWDSKAFDDEYWGSKAQGSTASGWKANIDAKILTRAGLIALTRALKVTPESNGNLIMGFLKSYLLNQQPNNLAINLNFVRNQLNMVPLAAVYISFDVYQNIRNWWNGHLSGSMCTKNIVDSVLTNTASAGGVYAGALVGGIFGPIGVVAGGVVGGYLSSTVVNFLSDKLYEWLFGLPQDGALKNAFKYFNLNFDATNGQINAAYRKLCKKHHPDKGGTVEEFLFVQLNMAIIKASKKKFEIEDIRLLT